jgi:hypothetical protein
MRAPPPSRCCRRPARVSGRLIQNKFGSEENVYLLKGLSHEMDLAFDDMHVLF